MGWNKRGCTAAVMVVALSACGGGDDDESSSGSASGIAETTATSDDATTTAEVERSSEEQANELLDLFPAIGALNTFMNESPYLAALDARDFELLSAELEAIVEEIVPVADGLDAVELTDPELQRVRDEVVAAYDDLISSMETVAQAGASVTEQQLNVLAEALDGYGPPVREFGQVVEGAAEG